MTTLLVAGKEIKVADEVFIATALLHREQPDREDFTISEIVNRAKRENLASELRPGVRVHISTHCVANRPPNPGKYQMLYDTGANTRRLLRSSDPVHPRRSGKIFPDIQDVPEKYTELISWAKERYGLKNPKDNGWLDSLISLAGTAKGMYGDPDEYVRKLREDWD